MYPILMLGDTTPALDVSGITSTVNTTAVFGLIEAVLPIVAVAILVGIVFYCIKWAVRLFRGV